MTIREKIQKVITPFAEAFSIPPGAEADLVNRLIREIEDLTATDRDYDWEAK